MAYNDYGAFVWRDGVRVSSHEDVELFDDSLADMASGTAVYAKLLKGRQESENPPDWASRCYHATFGDGDVRVGVYKLDAFTVVRRNPDGTFEETFRTYLGDDQLVKAFGLKHKKWVRKEPAKWRSRASKYGHERYEIAMPSDAHVETDAREVDGVIVRTPEQKSYEWSDRGWRYVHWWRKSQRCYPQGTVFSNTHRTRRRKAARHYLRPDVVVTKELPGVTLSWRRIEPKKDPGDIVKDGFSYIGADHEILMEVFCDFHDGHAWSARIGSAYGNGFEDEELSVRFPDEPKLHAKNKTK